MITKHATKNKNCPKRNWRCSFNESMRRSWRQTSSRRTRCTRSFNCCAPNVLPRSSRMRKGTIHQRKQTTFSFILFVRCLASSSPRSTTRNKRRTENHLSGFGQGTGHFTTEYRNTRRNSRSCMRRWRM